jgi:DNA-binding NarL/FixJ family response regulator
VKKALIVEDFRPIAEIWGSTLLGEQYESFKIIDNTDLVESEIETFSPTIILMDINLNGKRDGIETTKDVIQKYTEMKVIVLSMHAQPHMMERALEAGARGYITKSSPLSELKKALKIVESGDSYICEQMMKYR